MSRRNDTIPKVYVCEISEAIATDPTALPTVAQILNHRLARDIATFNKRGVRWLAQPRTVAPERIVTNDNFMRGCVSYYWRVDFVRVGL